MANALARLARAVLGVGDGRTRNPTNPKNTTNPQIPKKSILRIWYAKISISHPHGNMKDQKSALEMTWGPS